MRQLGLYVSIVKLYRSMLKLELYNHSTEKQVNVKLIRITLGCQVYFNKEQAKHLFHWSPAAQGAKLQLAWKTVSL